MKQSLTKPNFGFGVYLPENILTNDDLEKRNIILQSGRQLRAAQILEKIGVERRHIAGENETVVDLGAKAAHNALSGIKSDGKQIAALVASSSHPTAFHVAGGIAKKLGLNGAEVFDIHAACSGSALMFSYIYENQAKLKGKHVLLVATEKFTQGVVDLTHPDATKLDTSLGQTIFGDGAAAVSFTVGEDIVIHNALNKPLPDQNGNKDLIYMAMGENTFVEPCLVKPVASSEKIKDFPKGYFVQNGPKVFEGVINSVPGVIREIVQQSEFSPKDISLVVVHPGSKRLVDALRQKLEPEFKLYSEYADGNMSSVSMLYSFIKAIQNGLVGRGSKVVLCGFGAGSPDLYSSTVVVEIK